MAGLLKVNSEHRISRNAEAVRLRGAGVPSINDRTKAGPGAQVGRQTGSASWLPFEVAAVHPKEMLNWTAPCFGGRGDASGVGREHILGDSAPDTQKNELKPWKQKEWLALPSSAGQFVARMEDVMELYHEEYDSVASGGVF